MSMGLSDLIVKILLTWSLSSLLAVTNQESGPYEIFDKLRDKVGVKYNEASRCYGTNQVSSALCCIWCTSLWVGVAVSAVFDLRSSVLSFLVMPFVYRAGAIWLQQQIRGKV